MKNKCICIIPARGGSKRIPKKNIKNFLGKPIIKYSIENAISSNIFDKIIVSTDDLDIKNIALKQGAEVPFMRSKNTSNDYATIEEACIEVLENLNESYNYICCLFSTAPFVDKILITEAFYYFKKQKFNSLCTVIKNDKPIERSLILNRKTIKWENTNYAKYRTQDLPTRYFDAGQFYFSKVKSLYETKDFINHNTGYFELKKNMFVDIDNIDDWKFAEKLFKIYKK